MRLSDKVAWLEVEKQGSSLHIAYTPKRTRANKANFKKTAVCVKRWYDCKI